VHYAPVLVLRIGGTVLEMVVTVRKNTCAQHGTFERPEHLRLAPQSEAPPMESLEADALSGKNSGLAPAEAVPNSIAAGIGFSRDCFCGLQSKQIDWHSNPNRGGKSRLQEFIFQHRRHDSRQLLSLHSKRGPRGDVHGPK